MRAALAKGALMLKLRFFIGRSLSGGASVLLTWSIYQLACSFGYLPPPTVDGAIFTFVLSAIGGFVGVVLCLDEPEKP